MRTAVMGAGSIGMFLGASITKNGGQIDLIDTFKGNIDALNENGAKITGYADFTVPVKALTPDQMEGKYDLVFLCCLSQKMLQRISSNYRFILTFNTCLLLGGLAGLISPSVSAYLHNFSTMLISAASMRPCLSEQNSENQNVQEADNK